MRPVEAPCAVWHPHLGERVVINIGHPEAEQRADRNEAQHGPGTWTISLEAHLTAIAEMDLFGKSDIQENPVWIPWKQLSTIGEG